MIRKSILVQRCTECPRVISGHGRPNKSGLCGYHYVQYNSKKQYQKRVLLANKLLVVLK